LALLAFEHDRLLDIFGGKLSKMRLRFGIRHRVGMVPALGRLISQIYGALRHSLTIGRIASQA
jgi:hypothetical protein